MVATGLDAENSALSCLIAQPLVTAPIVSTTSLAQLQDILKVLALTGEDLAELDAAST